MMWSVIWFGLISIMVILFFGRKRAMLYAAWPISEPMDFGLMERLPECITVNNGDFPTRDMIGVIWIAAMGIFAVLTSVAVAGIGLTSLFGPANKFISPTNGSDITTYVQTFAIIFASMMTIGFSLIGRTYCYFTMILTARIAYRYGPVGEEDAAYVVANFVRFKWFGNTLVGILIVMFPAIIIATLLSYKLNINAVIKEIGSFSNSLSKINEVTKRLITGGLSK